MEGLCSGEKGGGKSPPGQREGGIFSERFLRNIQFVATLKKLWKSSPQGGVGCKKYDLSTLAPNPHPQGIYPSWYFLPGYWTIICIMSFPDFNVHVLYTLFGYFIEYWIFYQGKEVVPIHQLDLIMCQHTCMFTFQLNYATMPPVCQ